jgi:hypothetical protein
VIFGTPYFQEIKNLFGSSIIGYWPLWDKSGTVIEDISGNNRHGIGSNLSLLQSGIGDGNPSTLFNGTTSYGNIYSLSLANAFNGSEGSILIWGNLNSLDTVFRRLITIYVDSSNYVMIYKYRPALPPTPSIYYVYNAGGIQKDILMTPLITGWNLYGLTWSKSLNEVKAYINGLQTGTTKNALGNWSGLPGIIIIGALNTVPANSFDGKLEHTIILNRIATPTEILTTSTVLKSLTINRLYTVQKE